MAGIFLWCSVAYGSDFLYPMLNPSFEQPVRTIDNSWYNGVDGWGYVGLVGTTYAAPWVPASPASDGNQFAWADLDDFHLFQEVGPIQPDSLYTFQIDLFALQDSPSNFAEVLIEESDQFVAIMAQALYHPSWHPTREDFQLIPGQWVTVSVTFNGATFPSIAGHSMRVRVRGYHLAIDNARFIVSGPRAPRSFYVSSSLGSDANDGLSAGTPWQSFARFRTTQLVAGDVVALKRGDSWTEELHLWGKGTAGAPIQLGSYGTGNRPRITRSDKEFDRVVVVEGASHWRIRDLDCRNAKIGLYLRYGNDFHNEDVVVENCYFQDMDEETADPPKHAYELAWSTGIFLGGQVSAPNEFETVLDGLTIRNCAFENCAAGFGTNWYHPQFFYSRLRNVYLEECYATQVLSGGMMLNLVDGGHARRFRTFGRASSGPIGYGTTGGFMQGCRNFLIDDCEFAETSRAPGSADGCGFDFEGDSQNITFTNNVIHDNDGPAVLFLSTIAPNYNITIADCTFYNNALNPMNTDNAYEMKAGANNNGTGVISNVGMYRAAGASGWRSTHWGGFTVSNTRQLWYSSVAGRPAAWEFDADGNFQGWGGFNQWDSALVAGGVLSGISAGVDPYGHSGPTWINSHQLPFGRLRMQTGDGVYGQLFFITETDPVWDGAKSVAIPRIDGSMREYVLALKTCPDFKGVVTQVRVDPTDTPGAAMSIDYLCISNDGKVPGGETVEITASHYGTIKEGETLTLSVPAGSGHQWFHEGELIVDGPGTNGHVISGATTRVLEIANIDVSDTGTYVCQFDDEAKMIVQTAPFSITVLPFGLPAVSGIAIAIVSTAIAALAGGMLRRHNTVHEVKHS